MIKDKAIIHRTLEKKLFAIGGKIYRLYLQSVSRETIDRYPGNADEHHFYDDVLRVPNRMRRRIEGERFFGWQGRRSRRPVRVADAGGRRQAKNKPPECRLILLGALR